MPPTPATHTVHVEMDVEVPDGTYRGRPSAYVDLTLTLLAYKSGWSISSYHGGVTAITPNKEEG